MGWGLKLPLKAGVGDGRRPAEAVAERFRAQGVKRLADVTRHTRPARVAHDSPARLPLSQLAPARHAYDSLTCPSSPSATHISLARASARPLATHLSRVPAITSPSVNAHGSHLRIARAVHRRGASMTRRHASSPLRAPHDTARAQRRLTRVVSSWHEMRQGCLHACQAWEALVGM